MARVRASRPSGVPARVKASRLRRVPARGTPTILRLGYPLRVPCLGLRPPVLGDRDDADVDPNTGSHKGPLPTASPPPPLLVPIAHNPARISPANVACSGGNTRMRLSLGWCCSRVASEEAYEARICRNAPIRVR